MIKSINPVKKTIVPELKNSEVTPSLKYRLTNVDRNINAPLHKSKTPNKLIIIL